MAAYVGGSCPALAYQVMAMLWQASWKGTVRRRARAVRLRGCPVPKSLLENLCDLGLSGSSLAGEAPGHDDDHRPVDVGFVVGSQPLVVSDGAPVAGNP